MEGEWRTEKLGSIITYMYMYINFYLPATPKQTRETPNLFVKAPLAQTKIVHVGLR